MWGACVYIFIFTYRNIYIIGTHIQPIVNQQKTTSKQQGYVIKQTGQWYLKSIDMGLLSTTNKHQRESGGTQFTAYIFSEMGVPLFVIIIRKHVHWGPNDLEVSRCFG